MNSVLFFALIVNALVIVECQNELILKPDIYYLHIKSDIQYRFATTLVTSRIANRASQAEAVEFKLYLPDNAFISNFTLELEGKTYPGIVKEKEEARQEYEQARAQGHNAGIVSQSPRETNSFKVEVNVAAGSKVTFHLTYQELLQRKLGIYQHKIYIDPGQPIADLQVHVSIKESRNITDLRVPHLRTDILTNKYDEGPNLNAMITKQASNLALIVYKPTVEEQTENGLNGQFIVEYDVERAVDAGDVIVVGDYFVHYFAPAVTDPIPKDVLFVLDKSGSMDGKKMNQLKEAMNRILDDLREVDRFNVIVFDSEISKFYSYLLKANQESIRLTKGHIANIKANGGTDIHDSVLEGLKALSDTSSERAPIIVFLSDGEASSGITSSMQILKDVKNANRKEIPINTLAFGSGANWDLLKNISLQNNGIAKRIYEDKDSDLQITGFYAQTSDTLLKDVAVTYLENTVEESSLTTFNFPRYYKGSELIVCGKLNDGDTIKSSVLADSATGNVIMVLDSLEAIREKEIGDAKFWMMTEKVWAYLTIKDCFNDIDRGLLTDEENKSLNEKALKLSLKYNFVTRLTSMVVTIPNLNNTLPGKPKENYGGDEMMKTQGAFPSGNMYPGGAGSGVQNDMANEATGGAIKLLSPLTFYVLILCWISRQQ